MGLSSLLLLLLCTTHSAAQIIPVPDFHATGETAAMFGEDDDVHVLIETTTEATASTSTTSTTTVAPTTSLVGILPVTQTIRVTDDMPTKDISATPPNDPPQPVDTPSEPTTQPPPPSQPSIGYDFPSAASPEFVPPAPQPPLSDSPITITEPPPPPPLPLTTPAASLPPTQTLPPPQLPAPSPLHNDGSVVPDMLFVVDASGSMQSAWRRHLQCVSTIARPAVGHAKIGVILYSSKYKHRLHIPFAQYNDAATLDSMINALPFHGGVTNTGEALFEAVRVLEKERPQHVAVITLTDGYSWDALDRGASKIRALPGSTTYAVALEDVIVKKELDIIAGSAERVFTQPDSCDRLAQVISSGSKFRQTTFTTFAPELTSSWRPESTTSPNRYASASIGNELEARGHFDDRVFTVDGTTGGARDFADETIAQFEPEHSQKSGTYWAPQQNYLAIPRRSGVEQCSLDVVFAFDSTSHAGLPALLAASQRLLHSRVFKKRSVRIGAVKFSDDMDSRIVFPLDKASFVSLDSILRVGSHRGVQQALFLAAGLLRDAAVVRPTKRIAIVLSDVFDSAAADRALEELQSLNASVFVLHSTPMTTVTSHSFPGAAGLTTSVVSHEDISRVEQEVENLASACTRRLKRL